MATTSSPSSVSSCAMIEPVQPSPIITTSVFGNRWVMFFLSTRARRPLRPSGDADGWKRKTLIVTVNPIEIIVTGAGISDHLPGDHVAIAAVDWIGEKTHLYVLDDLHEKILSVDAVEFYGAAFEPT